MLEVQNCPWVKDWKSRKISAWHKSPCEVPSWFNHQSTWNFTNHWGSPMLCHSKIWLRLNSLTHGRLIQKTKSIQEKNHCNNRYFCTCFQIYKKVWKNPRCSCPHWHSSTPAASLRPRRWWWGPAWQSMFSDHKRCGCQLVEPQALR